MSSPEISADLIDEMHAINSILGLCAFAAEARRVLDELDSSARMVPALGAQLGELIEARNQWSELPDSLPEVLEHAHARMAKLISAYENQLG